MIPFLHNDTFSNMPVFDNLALATPSCPTNCPTGTLRSTFGSLTDLRKYHETHNPRRETPLSRFNSKSDLRASSFNFRASSFDLRSSRSSLDIIEAKIALDKADGVYM